jgi:hypothetical protein
LNAPPPGTPDHGLARRGLDHLHKAAAHLLHWPVPALASWLACAAFWMVLEHMGWMPLAAWAAAATLGLALALIMVERGASLVRVLLVAGGFPVASGLHALTHNGPLLARSLPTWLWLLPLALLLLLYPLRTWRDAPLFPTELGALDGLGELIPLPPGARVLDAGCGLGNGIEALRRVWPLALLEGVEWSWPIAWWAQLRCPGATIRRGDMWTRSWADVDLVYLFQRPDTMGRAMDKARAEMRRGSWLVSLEFEVPGARPHARLSTPSGKPIWLYRLPAEPMSSQFSLAGGWAVRTAGRRTTA